MRRDTNKFLYIMNKQSEWLFTLFIYLFQKPLKASPSKIFLWFPACMSEKEKRQCSEMQNHVA